MYRYRVGVTLFGLLIGLLLVRVVALLFAARPDNPLIGLLLALSGPLSRPFAALNRLTGQPRFGAQLDLAALATIGALLLLAAALHWLSLRSTRQPSTGA